MDNQRVFIWAALAVLLWINYTTWQRDYAPQAAPVASSQTPATQSTPPKDTLPELPSDTSTSTPTPAAQATPTPAAEQAVESADSKAGTVRVITDVLSIDISKRGGDLERADLLKYAQVKNHPELPVRLFNPQDPRYVA